MPVFGATFTTPGNYTTDKCEVTGGKGQNSLEDLINQSFIQPFDDDTGFTYDSDEVEFVGGVVRQKSQTPVDVTAAADFSRGADLIKAGGVAIATVVGGTINGDFMELIGGDIERHVDYPGALNFSSKQKGSIEFFYRPVVSGNPATNQYFIFFSESLVAFGGLIAVRLDTAGRLVVQVLNKLAGAVINSNTNSWVPVGGQVYKFQIIYDFDPTGTASTFDIVIDNVVEFHEDTFTCDRDVPITIARFGGSEGVTSSNGSFKDILFRTTNLTINWPHVDVAPIGNEFVETIVDLPTETYSLVGDIQSYDSSAITQVGSPRIIHNGKYWNGSNWVVSNGSYAQANSNADANTNLPTLTPSDILNRSIVFHGGQTQESIALLTTEYTAESYQEGNIEVNGTITASELAAILGSDFVLNGGRVGIVYEVNGVDKFYNESSGNVENSNRTSATSTLIADLTVTNLAKFLSLSSNSVKTIFVLTPADGQSIITIDNWSQAYDKGADTPVAVTLTPVHVYVFKTNQATKQREPVEDAAVTIALDLANVKKYREATGALMLDTSWTLNTNANGLAVFELVPSTKFEATQGYKLVSVIKDSDEISNDFIDDNLGFQVTDGVPLQDITDLLTMT